MDSHCKPQALTPRQQAIRHMHCLAVAGSAIPNMSEVFCAPLAPQASTHAGPVPTAGGAWPTHEQTQPPTHPRRACADSKGCAMDPGQNPLARGLRGDHVVFLPPGIRMLSTSEEPTKLENSKIPKSSLGPFGSPYCSSSALFELVRASSFTSCYEALSARRLACQN